MLTSSTLSRRTLATRNAGWARALARSLAARGARPNAVSVASVAVALAVALAFHASAAAGGALRASLLVAAAAGIQLRLLCNLLDGMLAVEHGLKGKTGDIFNDLPDRIADVLILVGAGYAIRHLPHGPALGWAAAVVALFTAYVRVLSGSLGLTQHFLGPMAKQHRMFTLTVASLLASAEALFGMPPRAILVGLILIVLGSIATAIRRTARLLHDAEAR
jgi:phosphatidylglycerophosphate synthase